MPVVDSIQLRKVVILVNAGGHPISHAFGIPKETNPI
jgi:hypothetical protein